MELFYVTNKNKIGEKSMKKRFLMLTCFLGLTILSLVACGGGTLNADTQKEVSSQQSESTQNETEIQEQTITESEDSKVVETETEQIQETESETPLPEDRAWIDEVYNDLIAGNHEDLITLLTSENLEEKVAPYIIKYWAQWDYEEAYGLITTDGKTVGVVLYENESYIFYSENNDGFEALHQGDFMFRYNKQEGNYSWIEEDGIHYSDRDTAPLNQGDIVMVWHM